MGVCSCFSSEKWVDNVSSRTGVYIICATNRLINTPSWSLLCFNTARTFPQGAFDNYMYVPPNPEEQGMILKALSGNKLMDVNVDLMSLRKDAACEKFFGADLSIYSGVSHSYPLIFTF